MTSAVDIQGFCHEKFEGVREAFAANFEAGDEVGASFAATVEGEPVVDLWGGHADRRGTRPWKRDTIANVWSTTKAMTVTCAHMLADRGLLDMDTPVADYWPEFAGAGKADIPVRYVLGHRSGVAGVTEPLPTEALYDWGRMTMAIAAQEPLWEPGAKHGYHALTLGFIVGELVRRLTGDSIGTFFRQEVAMPLNADFHIGLPEEHDDRVAEMVPPAVTASGRPGARSSIGQPAFASALGNPPTPPTAPGRREWRAAEIPAANGHGNARSLARVMAALALGGELEGVRLMGRAALERAIQEQAYGPDLVLGDTMRWGLGYLIYGPERDLGLPGRRAFGHSGWGGSLAVADPDARVSWAYVMNRMLPGTTGDRRSTKLAQALYTSL